MGLTAEVVNMEPLVNQAWSEVRFRDGSQKVQFRVNVLNDVTFYSDTLRVTTVLKNLLSNAIIYQRSDEQSPCVHIDFHADMQCGYLTVSDNGEGIPDEKFDKIFEMFYRNSEKSVGSGLGLYICKEIVNKLGGLIFVKSEIGKGSSFKIHLPNQLSSK